MNTYLAAPQAMNDKKLIILIYISYISLFYIILYIYISIFDGLVVGSMQLIFKSQKKDQLIGSFKTNWWLLISKTSFEFSVFSMTNQFLSWRPPVHPRRCSSLSWILNQWSRNDPHLNTGWIENWEKETEWYLSNFINKLNLLQVSFIVYISFPTSS